MFLFGWAQLLGYYSAGASTPLTIQAVTSNGASSTQKNHVLNTVPLSYDANGNLSTDQAYKYSWDAANRLVGLTFINPQPPSMTDNITFTYDGLGRRVGIVENHGSTVLTSKTFVWCGSRLCEERNATGSSVTKRFYALGEQISGTSYYYTKDHLGSVRELVNGSGAVTARYDYDSFGRQTKLSGTIDADFGYTGFYKERAIGLDLTWFRAYSPEKGRWLSRDPLGERNGQNLFEYVNNNTFANVDPLGLCTALIEPVIEGVVKVGTKLAVDSESVAAGAGGVAGMGLQTSGAVPWDPFGLYLGILTDIALMAAGVAFGPALAIGFGIWLVYTLLNKSAEAYGERLRLANPTDQDSNCPCSR